MARRKGGMDIYGTKKEERKQELASLPTGLVKQTQSSLLSQGARPHGGRKTRRTRGRRRVTRRRL